MAAAYDLLFRGLEHKHKIKIWPRRLWNAKDPKTTTVLRQRADFVVLGYGRHVAYGFDDEPLTGKLSSLQVMRLIRDAQRNALSNGQPDIRYNFMIGGDGLIFEGRGWTTQPNLPNKYSFLNSRSLYIALLGNFQDESPSEELIRKRNDLIKFGVDSNYITRKAVEIQLHYPPTYNLDFDKYFVM